MADVMKLAAEESEEVDGGATATPTSEKFFIKLTAQAL